MFKLVLIVLEFPADIIAGPFGRVFDHRTECPHSARHMTKLCQDNSQQGGGMTQLGERQTLDGYITDSILTWGGGVLCP